MGRFRKATRTADMAGSDPLDEESTGEGTLDGPDADAGGAGGRPLMPIERREAPTAGASARAEFERRRARHDERARRRLPVTLVVAGVGIVAGAGLVAAGGTAALLGWTLLVASGTWVLIRIVPSQSVLAWSTGAEGEEQTATILAPLTRDGFVVLHDRRPPGSRGNIDHIVIGPPGVFVVETKSYAGKLEIRGSEVRVAGRRRTEIIGQARREADAVAAVLGKPVTPLICVHRADLPWGRVELDGVRIVGPKELVKVLRSAPAVLSADEVRLLAERADATLRPAAPSPTRAR